MQYIQIFSFSLLLLFTLFQSSVFAKVVIDTPGTLVHNGPVLCGDAAGRVKVSTGVKWSQFQKVQKVNPNGQPIGTPTLKKVRSEKDGIYFQYTGADLANFHWIQFVYITYVQRNPDGTSKLLPLKMPMSSGNIQTHTEPNTRRVRWHVDSVSKTDPRMGAHVQPVDSAGYLDQPADPIDPQLSDVYKNKTAAAAFKVSYIFESYLLYKKNVCYKISWTKEQLWDRSANPQLGPAQTKFGTGGAANATNARQQVMLRGQYPNQTVVDPFPKTQ